MIENILIFFLGAFSSALIALVIFPAFTKRAARLARRNLELSLPRSLAEIAAAKDAVRAELAAKSAKIEAELLSTREAMVAERTQRSDQLRDVQVLKAEKRSLQMSLAETEDRLEAAREELRAREENFARIASEGREAESRRQMDADRMREAEERVREAERATSEARVAVAALDARTVALTAAIEDLRRERDLFEARALAAEGQIADMRASDAGASMSTGVEAAEALIRERRQLVEENSQLRRERDRYRLAGLSAVPDLPRPGADEPADKPFSLIDKADIKVAEAAIVIPLVPTVETSPVSPVDSSEQDRRVDALARGLSHLRKRNPIARKRSAVMKSDGGDNGGDRAPGGAE